MMTMQSTSLSAMFPKGKPILGMLHLGGETPEEKLDRALRETADMVLGGVDAIVVENYFGDAGDVRRVLDRLCSKPLPTVVGLNLLRDFRLGFQLVRDYGLSFLQIDSVAGHLAPEADADYAAELAELRAQTTALLFGGVRFKYQPVNSGRTEAEDLRLGMMRADAIVVTGAGTGEVTANDKIARFRAVTGPDYPLLIGAGLTAEAVASQLPLADGAIVGSYFKDSYKDTGVVDPTHVVALMAEVTKLRTKAREPIRSDTAPLSDAPPALVARPLSPEAFAPYGRIHDLGDHAGEAEADIVATRGPDWTDRYTRAPLLTTNGSLGLTRAGACPFALRQMERHPNTEEALFCLEAPVVLAVAAAGDADAPRAGDVEAFVIPVGTVVVLRPGTWHDACRGVTGPVGYYWMATVGTGTDWRDLEDGPITLGCPA